MGREAGAERKGRASGIGRLARFGRRHTVLRAVIIFTLLMGLFYAFIHTPLTGGQVFRPYLQGIAIAIAAIVNLFGYGASAVDMSVISSAFSMEIIRGCDAIEPTAIFVSAVMASPVSAWSKIAGILCGTLILALVNLLRLVSLFFIGAHLPSVLDIMHEDVWQVAFIVLAITLWATWARWATRGKRERFNV
jgi:exosortase/archaeosortase family protein